MRVPRRAAGWPFAAWVYLAAGLGAAVAVWSLAVWDTPRPGGPLRLAATFVLSLAAGAAAGAGWLAAAVLRRALALGERASSSLGRPLGWFGLSAAGPVAAVIGQGRRAAAWLSAAAWAMLALDAALLYLTLY